MIPRLLHFTWKTPDLPRQMAAYYADWQRLHPDWEVRLWTDASMRDFVAEAYPDLKANQNMMQLTEELTSTENKVAFARQAYNDSVMAYNNKREVFPSSVLAGMFNFKEAALLDIPADRAEVRDVPKVTF